MSQNKKTVLTATTCNSINKLCQAVEVLTGERVCLGQFDFNTGSGAVIIGDSVSQITAHFSRSDLIDFRVGIRDHADSWYVALFDDDGVVKIADQDNSHKKETIAGLCPLRWVGTTKDDRREEPLFLKNFEHSARVLEITLEELLSIVVR